MARKVAYGEGRDALISTTVRVAAANGLRGLTFRAVAAEAQVNNSLVAHHFGTRERLLAAALEWSVEQSVEATHLYDLSSEEAFADAFISTVVERRELHAFQYEMILESNRNPVYREPVDRLYSRYHEVAEASLRDFGITHDLEAEARRTFAALDGLVMQYLAGVGIEKLRAALHNLWESLRAAVRTP